MVKQCDSKNSTWELLILLQEKQTNGAKLADFLQSKQTKNRKCHLVFSLRLEHSRNSFHPCVCGGRSRCCWMSWLGMNNRFDSIALEAILVSSPTLRCHAIGVKRSRPAHLSYATGTVTIQSHLHLHPPLRPPLILSPKQVKFRWKLWGGFSGSALMRLALSAVIISLTLGEHLGVS